MPGFALQRWAVRKLVVLSLAFAAVAQSTLAWSQTDSTEQLDAARAWFREGLSLEVAGNWAQALAKFERVAEVRLTPQVRFHIARCKEHLGRLTEALGDYRLSEYEAEREGLLELPEIVRARAELEARLPKLTIVRGEGAERARIELDGVEIGEASIGTTLGLDPGPHHVVATSPEREPFEHSFLAEEGGGYEVRVELSPSARAVSREVAPGGDPEPSAEWSAPQAKAREPAVLPWVLSGVAAAGAAAGVVFLVRRSDAIDEQQRYCIGAVCNAAYRSQVEDAEAREATSGTLAITAFSLSAVALGTAVTLWLTEEESEARASSLRVAAGVGGIDVVWGVPF